MPESLGCQLVDHAADWPFSAEANALKDRSVLVVSSDDGLAADNERLAAALLSAGDPRVATTQLPTDHAYSDRRIELSYAVSGWLARLPK